MKLEIRIPFSHVAGNRLAPGKCIQDNYAYSLGPPAEALSAILISYAYHIPGALGYAMHRFDQFAHLFMLPFVVKVIWKWTPKQSFSRPSHDKQCWPTRVGKLKLLCVNNTTTCWQAIGDKIELVSILANLFLTCCVACTH